MGVYTNLAALTVLASEQAAVSAAVGYEDFTGELTTIVNELGMLKTKIARLVTYVPSGTNLTALNTAATALA